MLIETHELTLANAGLHGLDEPALLRLFATVQAHAIVAGTGHTLRDIANAEGVPLYPAFYRTLVRIPPAVRLEDFRVWTSIDVGVDVRRYGRMVLCSSGVIDATGALSRDPEAWDRDRQIQVEANLVFVQDDPSANEPQVEAPSAGAIAELEPIRHRPATIAAQRQIRVEGAIHPEFTGRLRLLEPLRHPVLLGRDVQVGRAMMFSAFTTLLDAAEQTLLTEQWPPMCPALLAYRRLVDREIYYFGNLRQGETAVVDTQLTVSECPPGAPGARGDEIAVASVEVRSEIYEHTSRHLLVAAHARELLAVPRGDAVYDVKRLLRQHGGLA